MSKITIEIDSKWQKIVRSPIFYIVASLQGVAGSFAPLFLYWSGKGMFGEWETEVVIACIAVIFPVLGFYMLLGTAGAIVKSCVPESFRRRPVGFHL